MIQTPKLDALVKEGLLEKTNLAGAHADRVRTMLARTESYNRLLGMLPPTISAGRTANDKPE